MKRTIGALGLALALLSTGATRALPRKAPVDSVSKS